MKKKLLLLLFGLGGLQSQAQLIDPEPIIANATEDVNYLVGGYVMPVGQALIATLNNGWYRSAQPLQPGSFSINIAPTVIRIPSDQDQFLIENSKLQELELANGAESALSPTAFGSENEGPLLRSTQFGSNYSFRMPGGVESDILPAASINAVVGLPFSTNLHLRVLPRLSLNVGEEQELNILNYGIGGMHSLSQYFLPEDHSFSLSIFAGYSHLNVLMPLESGEDHEVEIISDGFTARGIASYTFWEVLTPYVAAGISSGQSQINVNGTFTYNSFFGSTTVTDPVQVDASNEGSLTFNAGLSALFLKVISLDVNYTYSDYESLTAALGVQIEL